MAAPDRKKVRPDLAWVGVKVVVEEILLAFQLTPGLFLPDIGFQWLMYFSRISSGTG
jgi:hypothetical protein